MTDNIRMDLCKDYDEMVQAWMQERGIQTDKCGFELWYEFFNLQKKSVPVQKRKVLFSKEFTCPSNLELGMKRLAEKLEHGQDVSLYLSKDSVAASEFDSLLYDWGIYHFHLGEKIDNRTGRIERTGPLLFAKIDAQKVYCINVYTHGKGNRPWSKQEMIRILHQNWPETIQRYRIPGEVHLCPDTISPPTDSEYADLRKNGVSTIIFVEDGVAYFSPGGGYTASGHSCEIITHIQRVNNALKMAELRIKENIASIAAHIGNSTGQPSNKSFHFKLVGIESVFYVAELQSKQLIVEVKF